MFTIWKYTLSLGDVRLIAHIPEPGALVACQASGDDVSLWFTVDPELPGRRRVFEAVGTGMGLLPGNADYVGTAQVCSGRLVLHVFERLDSN